MDFTVSHFIGIIAIIVIAIKSIGAYYGKVDIGNEKEIIEEDNDNTISPRVQHYKFAHEILKNMFLEDIDRLIKETLSSENELKRLWYDVGQFYAKQYQEAEELDGTNIQVTAKEFEDTLFIVISMPEAKDVPEAYFIGLIIPRRQKDNSRYITLEHGEDGSVLCEWTQESHLNFGEGPEPTLHNFQDQLISMGNVSAKTWNDAKAIYSGEDWMISLWNWADTNNISPLNFPRNSGDLQNLNILSLSFMNLDIEYLPKEIGQLSNLDTFALQNSNLKALPTEFSNLMNLKYLYIDGNKLTELPESFCNLVNLERIFLGNNQLKSLPDCIGNLQKLTVLSVFSNQLKDLPLSISKLNLKEFMLSDNPIEHISREVQNFLNSTIKEEALTKEPFTILWQACDKNSDYTKYYGIPEFDGYLPFFLTGDEVSNLENNKGVSPKEDHLLAGIIYAFSMIGKGSIRLREKDVVVLTELMDKLGERYRFETREKMVLDVANSIRDRNGKVASRIILKGGNKLLPESSKIKSDLILDLWAVISENDDNSHLLEEIPALAESINLEEIHEYSRELVCYYGLCALIFISLSKNEDYLASDTVDKYLKNYYYPNVTDKLLINKAVALMENPKDFKPIDLSSL